MFWLIVVSILIAATRLNLIDWSSSPFMRWRSRGYRIRLPSRNETLDFLAALITALFILHWIQLSIEADPLRCNALIDKPGSLFRSVLTCQKTYHYQPDPFTG